MTSLIQPAPHADLPVNLHGWRRRAAYWLWFAAVAAVLGLILAGAAGRQQSLIQSADPRALARLGLTAGAYAQYLTGLSLLSVLAHLSVAAYIFWRRAAHGMCWLVSFTLVVTGAIVHLALFYPTGEPLPVWTRLAVNLLISLSLTLSIVLLYLFPDGEFHPGWTRWAALLWAGVAVLAIFAPGLPISLPSLPAGLQVLVLLGFAGTGVYAQVYRYVNISSPVQRQQAKWAGLGLVAAVVGPLAYFVPFVILPGLETPPVPPILVQRVGAGFFALSLAGELVFQTLFTGTLFLFPLLFGIAILRYRLWDIDLLINRAIVYGTLSAVLTLTFLLSVVLLQAGFQVVTGQRQGQLVTVLSTLLIAALAAPCACASSTPLTGAFIATATTPPAPSRPLATPCVTKWTSTTCARACWTWCTTPWSRIRPGCGSSGQNPNGVAGRRGKRCPA
jgi:hypothetical protein